MPCLAMASLGGGKIAGQGAPAGEQKDAGEAHQKSGAQDRDAQADGVRRQADQEGRTGIAQEMDGGGV